MNEWMNEWMYLYTAHITVSLGGLQFYLSEIGRQLVKAPLAAAITPYLISPTHPTHAWNVQWNSFQQVCGFFNVPCWPCNIEDAGDGAYGL